MPEKTNEKPIETSTLNEKNAFPILSKGYWLAAAKNFSDVKMLCFAAIIIALRIAVKFIAIPLAGDILRLTFDSYVNSIGSLVYGPLVGLAVGAVSDTLGCIVHPNGMYFFPFIFVEMSSSFIFGLFLWKRKISAPRVLASKFAVNFFCNIILNSLLMKPYMRMISGSEYPFINLTRIAKSLVLFPLEAMLITLILAAMIPPLKSTHLLPGSQENVSLRKKDIVLVIVLFALSVGLVLFYIFWLKDFIAAHNIKLW